MTDTHDVEKAERIGRSRARLFVFQGLLFLIWQTTFFSTAMPDGPVRAVDSVRIWTWLLWAIVLLALLATGGGLMRGKAVRALLDDELTRRNRVRAYVTGFWLAMGSAIAVYLISLFEPVSGREAIHLIVSIGIGSALFAFGIHEKRSQS